MERNFCVRFTRGRQRCTRDGGWVIRATMGLAISSIRTEDVSSRATAPLRSLVPANWARALSTELDSPSFQALSEFVDQESRRANVFPPRAQIFAALKRTPLNKVKVVILGQDPYPKKGDANGLSFPSLRGARCRARSRTFSRGFMLTPEYRFRRMEIWGAGLIKGCCCSTRC